MKPHPVLYDEPRDDGADDARDGADGVGDAHQDGGVLRGDVQVVDGETSPGEAAAAQRERYASGGSSSVKFGGFEFGFESDFENLPSIQFKIQSNLIKSGPKSRSKPENLD